MNGIYLLYISLKYYFILLFQLFIFPITASLFVLSINRFGPHTPPQKLPRYIQKINGQKTAGEHYNDSDQHFGRFSSRS